MKLAQSNHSAERNKLSHEDKTVADEYYNIEKSLPMRFIGEVYFGHGELSNNVIENWNR